MDILMDGILITYKEQEEKEEEPEEQEPFNNDKNILNNDISSSAVFDFINQDNKKSLLNIANEILHINKSTHNTIIFVYSPPKVGSTSIVSSLRLFGINKFCVIHIHDEEMLRVIGHISGITINEIILYNKYLGRDVYVIDVFRCPIERKISTYFEKVGVYHFNNSDDAVNKYSVKKVINRFNKIFPHIGNGDHFIDKYNIPIPDKFDWGNKYLQIENNGIKYIKLRLKDASHWGNILTKLLNTKICIVKDYETSKKAIKDLYSKFKNTYRIPKNLLDEVINTPYVNYYYSPEEKNEYYSKWLAKSTDFFLPYTSEQYKMYEELTMENSHIDFIQTDHYMDEGCRCKACNVKRRLIVSKILHGIDVNDRVVHNIAKKELLKNRIEKIDILNHNLTRQKVVHAKTTKNFVGDMKSVVSGKIKY
jgi:hypothetical protein